MVNLKIAILIPCYNEAITISSVVKDFQTALPDADIYIYDNNSTDDTYEIALDLSKNIKNQMGG